MISLQRGSQKKAPGASSWGLFQETRFRRHYSKEPKNGPLILRVEKRPSLTVESLPDIEENQTSS